MSPAGTALRGRLALTLDPALLNASLTFTVDPAGEDWNLARVEALLKSHGLVWGREGQARIEDAVRALGRLDSGSQTVVALQGEPPGDPVEGTLEWKRRDVPEDLAARSEVALAAAPPPRVFDVQVIRERIEETQTRRAALPFLKPREEKRVRVVRRESRIEVGVDPRPLETGFARRNDVLAAVVPGRPGRAGRNLRGEPIAARRPERIRVLVGEGAVLRGNEVQALYEGFYRRGRNWVDVIPYREAAVLVSRSADGGTCLLDFVPGTTAPPPADEVLARAQEAGFAASELIPREAIEALLARAVSESVPLAQEVISLPRDGEFDIEVAPDRMRVGLSLRKASGAGRSLSLPEVGKAINALGLKGLHAARVRADILAFLRGPERELLDYPLAVGAPAAPAVDGAVRWSAELLAPERAREIESRLGPDSSGGFPPAEVELAAFVKAGQPVARPQPAVAGRGGRDVFGNEVAAAAGRPADLHLGRGLTLRGDEVAASEDGVLEVISQDGAVFARVREYHENEVAIRISESRMEASLSLFVSPASQLAAETVKAAIRMRGVIRGVDERLVEELVARAARGESVRDAVVARGREPVDQKGRRLSFHGSVVMARSSAASASNGVLSLAVAEGQEIAVMEPPPAEARDGYDVFGANLPARRAPASEIKAGPNVERVAEPDGRVRFVASRTGEVFYDGSLLDVRDTVVIGEARANGREPLLFAAGVRVTGNVESGARIFAGGDVHVDGTVGRSVVSSEGSISIAGAVRGGGRAVLRARGGIAAAFAEQATLLAVGDIRITDGCSHCRISSNGRVLCEGAAAILVGGRLKARAGVEARSVGSREGIRTEISFGQDYLAEDQIDRETRAFERVRSRIARLDKALSRVEPGDPRRKIKVEGLSRAKVKLLRALERIRVRLFGLREKFEAHTPSEVVIEGTVYPGVVFESHGRSIEVRSRSAGVVVTFDQSAGQLAIRPRRGRA